VRWAPVAAAVWLCALAACTDRWLDPPPPPAAIPSCPWGTILDTATGKCFPAGCTTSDDCPAGYSCNLNTGSCVPPEPVDPVDPTPRCSVGAVRCDEEGERQICEPDGWATWACQPGTSCHGGYCRTCVPEERRCAADGSAAYEFCAADGNGWIAVDCLGPGATCVDGYCRICTPGETRCDPGGVAVCDATGARWNTVACGEGDRCDMVGDTATCVPMACTPNTSTCDPVDARQRLVCREDGSGVLAVPCPTGSVCRMPQGQCLDECGIAALEGRGAGCEYWFTHLPNGGGAAEPVQTLVLRLTNPGTEGAALRITTSHAAAPVLQNAILQPGVSQDFPLPWQAVEGTTRTGGAFHLESSRPILAHLISRVESGEKTVVATAGATVLLPQHLLAPSDGQPTYVAWSPRHQSTEEADAPAILTVVGTRPSTHVEVEFSADTAVSLDGEIQGWQRGERAVFQLGAGDVLQFATAPTGKSTEEDGRREWLNDFSGTWLRSDEPVAVFAGAAQTSSPLRTAPDHVEEQLPPTSLWARRYAAIPRNEHDRFTILAGDAPALALFHPPVFDEDGVQVQVQSLPARSAFRFRAERPFEVRASERVLLVQQVGGSESTSDTGAVVVPPVDRGRNRYGFELPDAANSEIFLVAKADAEGAAPEVTLAGQPVEEWVPLAGTELLTARIGLCIDGRFCNAEGFYALVAAQPVLAVIHEGGGAGLSYVGGIGDAPAVTRPNPY